VQALLKQIKINSKETPSYKRIIDKKSSFPYFEPHFAAGETAARAHVTQYFARKLAHSYKATRNGLTGLDYSSKFSPWLASGALSPRVAYAELKAFEAEHGANDGSYWLWFELLWRDYFRLLHLQHGRKLYTQRGLAQASAVLPPAAHTASAFNRWCASETGEPLVDAGMRELAATGYLSNRLRQVVASYLIHDLACDWRAGAAWFEAQLLDYDVYSNQGNWLYIAGRGTDPRGGRRFNPQKQTQHHDAGGSYRGLWSARGG
jgi:deoxyribodipyrimidine photo-lyase